MGQQSEKAIADLVKFLTTSLEQGKEFVLEQAPAVAQEIIKWEIVAGWMALGACFIGVLLGGILLYFAYQEREEFLGFLGVVAVLFSLSFAAENIRGLVKAYTAPKLVIIEEIKRL